MSYRNLFVYGRNSKYMAVISPDSITCAEGREKEYFIEEVIPKQKWGYAFFKRGFDIVVSFLVGVVLLVPMLLVSLIIVLDSKGPAIYKQERLGKNGKPFMMYKFRSMRVEAEVKGPQWADKNDDRCTRVGRVIRKIHVDEFPQLLNIFLGQMSFVGPRPERAYFYDRFETYIHGFRNRLSVRPGLTGWAQVNGGYDVTPEQKIVLDMEYIQKRSLLMDAKCILKTVKLIFTREGAR